MNDISKKRLKTCHVDLQTVFTEVDKYYSTIILEGHRGEKDQNKAFAEGKSTLRWPLGKHNAMPSMALDAAPAPIDWSDKYRYYHYAGIVMEFARRLKESGEITHSIRWGGDWNSNKKFNDQKFMDLVHFELVLEGK